MALNNLAYSRLHGTYLITHHDQYDDERLLADSRNALIGGAGILQYRDKSGDAAKRLRQAEKLRKLTTEYSCLLIINDDVELALQVAADGVHLGQHDNAIQLARSLLGPDSIIGSSCYNQLDLALQASSEGADYVAFGRFFPSSTKPAAVQAQPQLLKLARDKLDVPIVAIGGITHDNASGLIKAGADMIAVINAVFAQPDITSATRQFQNLFRPQG